MIGVAGTVLLMLSPAWSQAIGGTVTASSSAAATTVTASSLASATTVTAYPTSSVHWNQTSPVTVSSSVGPSYCWWAPEGASSYAQPSATVTLYPTTTCFDNVTSTIYATFSGPAATNYSSPYPGATTTASGIVIGRQLGSSAAPTVTVSSTTIAQNATQYFPTIVYGDGTATAYPTTFPTMAVNGSVLVCASTYGGNGSAVATTFSASSPAPTNATATGNITDAESLKSTGGENGASTYAGSGVAITLTAFALLHHFMA